MRRVVCIAAAALALAAPARASDPIAELEAAVARHADDPDLSWALVRSLAEEGELGRAVERLGPHLERWPERPPGAWLWYGRWLQELGRDAEALDALAQAIARDAGSGIAHLHAGLSARRLGRLEEARAHFDEAARLEPALAAEARLLAGLARLELGDEEGARHVLGEVAVRHGESDAGNAARLVLEGAPRFRKEPLVSLDAFGGVQFDSNVTLESGVDFPGLDSDQDDVRFVYGSGVTLRPVRGERLDVEVGVRYDESRHVDLQDYDTQRVFGLAGGRYLLGSRAALGLSGWVGYTTLDDDPYLLEGALRPSLVLGLGHRAGVVQLHALGQRFEYEDKPLFASLDRDGWSYGGGVEHIVSLPFSEGSWAEGSWVSWGGGYTRRDTESDRDLLGFEGAYDHHRFGALARLHLPMPWKVAADARFAFDAERYDNENLIDALTDNGVGRLDPRRRADDVFALALSLARPFGRFTDLEVSYGYTDRMSNVDLYAYDRHVVGMTVRVHTP